MYRSPAAPPPSPTSPWLAKRRRALSLMPAGTVTPTVRVVRTRPWPMQLGHGFLMMVPWPSQRSQGAEVIIWPSMVRTTFCMNPCPWQSGQVTGCAPPWAPEPPHSWHRENVLILTCAVPPNTAVFKSMDAEAKASRPGWVRGTGPCEPPPNAEPKNVENTSLISPKPAPEKPPAPAFGLFGSTPESYIRRLSGLDSTS